MKTSPIFSMNTDLKVAITSRLQRLRLGKMHMKMKVLTDCYAQTEVEEMESYNHLNLSGFSPTNTMLLDNHNLTELSSGSFASNIPWSEIPGLVSEPIYPLVNDS
jgi:hypothetical protein